MRTRIKEYRLRNNLTQAQLADLVHVTDRTIISIEKEKYNPSLMLAYRLAQVFHTTVEDLCQLADNMRLEDADNENL
ncbi:helix-turn-helix transcriptional regulator [Schleiferilactobacillus harbinensis]|uniref:helix-turn-helix transcriptional regulator n=1 Tax=Schleiferilactobacillus harbinensis TaxID=304207 RepID=UPI00345EA365